MKHLHRVLLTIAALTAVVLIAPLTNGAATAATPAPFLTGGFTADGASVVATLRDGTFVPNAANTELTLVNRDGKAVDRFPLVGTLDGVTVPVGYALSADRSTATLTPGLTAPRRASLAAAATDAAQKKPTPRAKRYTKQQRYDQMMKELQKGWKDFTPASTLIGGLIGFIVFGFPGAAIGAFIGAYIGYQTTNPKAWPSVVNWFNTP